MRRPKAPNNSAQIAAAQQQSAELERQRQEAEAAKEALAQKNTEELKGQRRRGKGRSALITTSEKGFTESNQLTA